MWRQDDKKELDGENAELRQEVNRAKEELKSNSH